jgi:hypothetical protein
MDKRTSFILIDILIFALIAYGLYFFMNTTKNQTPGPIDNGNKSNDSVVKVIEKDGFKFEYKYVSENKWESTLTGNLPTPCHKLEKDLLVRESYPEQVVVNVKIAQPDKDVMCAQVISPVEVKDVVNVSKGATFELQVETM